jgi:phosphoribosylanthranilate isomerase
VQLHGEISAAQVKRLRTLVPHLGLIKSLVVKDDNREELAARVTAFTPYVDAFLTDTFDANTGACGATGRPHDWRISRALVELSRRPVILAGGLTAANVGRAVLQVGPAGVDVHTGIEGPDGRKDKALAAAFVAAARRAWQTSV